MVVESSYHGHVVVDAEMFPRVSSISFYYCFGKYYRVERGSRWSEDRGAGGQTEIHFYIVDMMLIYNHKLG